ncbi:MAG: iron-containing alcohol dehydrogenase [Bacilli bacterium]
MLSFIKYNPTKLYFGVGQIENLNTLVPTNAKILLVYGSGSVKTNGVYEEVINQLNIINATLFELADVEPNPRLTTVEKGIEICKNEGIDFILAVGGGSVIDASKAIAVGSTYEGNVWDIITKKTTATSALPFGTVLTLAATGSEMNSGSVITNWDTREKIGWGSPFSFPQFSIVDPSYTCSVPKNQTIYGIVDTMSHALEQYFNIGEHTPLTDQMTEGLLRTVIETAPHLLSDLKNVNYREIISYSSTLALNGTLTPGAGHGDWACHGIEHAVSAVYDIPHGGGLAIIFPNWIKFISNKRPKKAKQLAERVFQIDTSKMTDNEAALAAADALRSFWTSIGAPSSLSDYNIDASQMDMMVNHACPIPEIGYYVKLSPSDVREILTSSL